MNDAVKMTDLAIADLEISAISDAELESAFSRVVAGHKDAIKSIKASMEDADDIYKKYLDPNFVPLEEVAKKDRAELNKAEKNIAEQYATLKEAYEKPLQNIETNIKTIRKAIKDASDRVDRAVKAYEELQKSNKRREIESYFVSKKFDLVPLESIWSDKWLNKTMKMVEVAKEIDAAIAKIYADVEVLEKIPDHSQMAKAMYLRTLDMGAALREVDALKANAEKLAREEANRKQRKMEEECRRNEAAENREEQDKWKEEIIQSKVDEAVGLPVGTTAAQAREEIIEFTVTFKGTKAQLLKLREFMTDNGIPYTKGLLFESEAHARQIAKNRNLDAKIYSFIYVPAA